MDLGQRLLSPVDGDLRRPHLRSGGDLSRPGGDRPLLGRGAARRVPPHHRHGEHHCRGHAARLRDHRHLFRGRVSRQGRGPAAARLHGPGLCPRRGHRRHRPGRLAIRSLPLFGEPGRVLQAHWLPACLMALATAVVFVNSALLVGLKRPFAGSSPTRSSGRCWWLGVRASHDGGHR